MKKMLSAIAAAIIAVPLAMTAPSQAFNLTDNNGVVLATGPIAADEYIEAQDLVYSDGSLISTYSGETLGFTYSNDAGSTWSERIDLTLKWVVDSRAIAVDGGVLVTFINSNGLNSVKLTKSGSVWSASEVSLITATKSETTDWAMHFLRVAPNGELFLFPTARFRNFTEILALKSTDDGATWTQLPTPLNLELNRNYNDFAVTFIANNPVISYMRQGVDEIGNVYNYKWETGAASFDGTSWTQHYVSNVSLLSGYVRDPADAAVVTYNNGEGFAIATPMVGGLGIAYFENTSVTATDAVLTQAGSSSTPIGFHSNDDNIMSVSFTDVLANRQYGNVRHTILQTTNSGETWTKTLEHDYQANDPQDTFVYSSRTYAKLSNGTLVSTILLANNEDDGWTLVLNKSTDNGATWSEDYIFNDGAVVDLWAFNITDINGVPAMSFTYVTDLYWYYSGVGTTVWFEAAPPAETKKVSVRSTFNYGKTGLNAAEKAELANLVNSLASTEVKSVTVYAPNYINLQPAVKAAASARRAYVVARFLRAAGLKVTIVKGKEVAKISTVAGRTVVTRATYNEIIK